jgi:hypothetical protein
MKSLLRLCFLPLLPFALIIGECAGAEKPTLKLEANVRLLQPIHTENGNPTIAYLTLNIKNSGTLVARITGWTPMGAERKLNQQNIPYKWMIKIIDTNNQLIAPVLVPFPLKTDLEPGQSVSVILSLPLASTSTSELKLELLGPTGERFHGAYDKDFFHRYGISFEHEKHVMAEFKTQIEKSSVSLRLVDEQ